MNLIRKFIEGRQAASLAAAQAEQERRQARVAKAEQDLQKSRMQMFALPCPFQQGNCRQACVHFQTGRVVAFDAFDGNLLVYIAKPRCRMWPEQ